MQYKIVGELDLKKARERIKINKTDIEDAPLDFFQKNNFKTLIQMETFQTKKTYYIVFSSNCLTFL